MRHTVCLDGEIRTILSGYPLLSGAMFHKYGKKSKPAKKHVRIECPD